MQAYRIIRPTFRTPGAAALTALLWLGAHPGGALLTAPSEERAHAVPSRIASVQVYTDQALVTRTGETSLARGRNQLRFPDLPAGVSADSVQLRITPPEGVRILEVRTETLHKRVFKGKEAKEADERLRKAQSALRRLTDEYRALEKEAEFLRAIEVGKFRGDAKTERRIDSGRWEETLDFIRRSLAGNNKRTAALVERVDRAREDLTVALTLAERFRSGQALSRKEVHVLLECTQPKRVSMQLDYLVTNAGWFPNYTARVETTAAKPNEGKVRLLAYALVRNRTGEDWGNVQLRFSAADPAESAALPALYSWRIRARLQPTEAPSGRGSGARANESRAPAAEKSRAGADRFSRSKRKKMSPARRPEPKPTAAEEAPAEQRMKTNVDKARSYYTQNQTQIRDVRAQKRSRAVESNLRDLKANKVAQERAYEGGRYQEALEKSEKVLLNIGRLDPQYQALFKEEEQQARDIRLRSLRLIEQQDLMRNLIAPRRSARGYDYRYAALGTETVRSDGTFHRILVNDLALTAALVYESAPERRPLAFLTGTASYQGDVPLLSGPMAVFHNTDYVGAARLGNTSARETFALHLGNDPTISISRKVEEFRTKSGLLTEQYDFKRTVRIKLENRRKQPTTLVVLDRIPVPADEQVTVSSPVFSVAPEAASRKDRGLYRFRVTIPAGKKKEITIQYTLSHPVNVIPRYSESSYPDW